MNLAAKVVLSVRRHVKMVRPRAEVSQEARALVPADAVLVGRAVLDLADREAFQVASVAFQEDLEVVPGCGLVAMAADVAPADLDQVDKGSSFRKTPRCPR